MHKKHLPHMRCPVHRVNTVKKEEKPIKVFPLFFYAMQLTKCVASRFLYQQYLGHSHRKADGDLRSLSYLTL